MMLIYLSMMETDEDKSKFEIIYTAYKNLLFYVVNRILGDTRDSEDVVHATFVKVAEIIGQIDEAKCPKTKNLIVTIAERKAIDLYRVRKRRTILALDEEATHIPTASMMDDIPSCAPLAQAIALLPTKYRQLILLKFDGGYSDREIAEILSMSVANVQKTIQRAKAKLSKTMEEMEATYETI